MPIGPPVSIEPVITDITAKRIGPLRMDAEWRASTAI